MTELDGDATIAEVIGVAFSSSVERLVAHEDGVRAGADPEGVHQARVATRRLRSDLRTFRDFVVMEWAEDLRSELKWLGDELGEVRDIEVLLDRLRRHGQQLPDAQQEDAELVVRRLVAEWEAARTRIVETLAGDRYEGLRDRLVAVGSHPRCTTWANLGARGSLPRLVRHPWRKLEDAVDELGDDPSDDSLHATRIRAKRARYAAEAAIPVFGKAAREFSKAMADVQTVLGDHQDAVVARTWIAKTASDCTPDVAFAAGMLADIETRAAEESRAEFPEVWDKASRRKLRTWL